MGSSGTPKNSSPVSNAVSSSAVSPNNISHVMGNAAAAQFSPSALNPTLSSASHAGGDVVSMVNKGGLAGRRSSSLPRPKTKFVCTIGPSSASRECLESLIQEGMSIARLNMVHCSHQFVS